MMAFSTDLLELMNSTIRVSTRSSHNQYGEATFGSSTTSYRARIVEKPGYVRGDSNEEIAYRHVAWVRSTGAASITATDRLTIPSSFAGSSTPPVVGVERYPDEEGVHHTKVLFGY